MELGGAVTKKFVINLKILTVYDGCASPFSSKKFTVVLCVLKIF
jgi:hypothetical protein